MNLYITKNFISSDSLNQEGGAITQQKKDASPSAEKDIISL